MELDVQELGERGYAVGQGFLGPRLLEEAITAAWQLVGAGVLAPAGVGRGTGHRLAPGVRGDHITWVDPSGPLAGAWQRFEALREHLNREAFLGLGSTELQLAWYPGEGSFYARHRDAFQTPGGRPRRITAIVYLNRGWREDDGGRLRLHVEPAAVDVDPSADTWVVFRSQEVEHEVLPAFAPRLALTAWFG